MSIIGLLGRKGHGKDTIADYLVQNYNYSKFAFALSLKDIIKQLFDFNDDQLYGNSKEEIDPRWGKSPRWIMQFLGTDVFRNTFGEDFWIKSLKYKIKDYNLVVISDVRFQNEADFIKEIGGKIWKVERNINNNIYSNHESENNIDQIEYDLLIKNEHLNELYETVDVIMRSN